MKDKLSFMYLLVLALFVSAMVVFVIISFQFDDQTAAFILKEGGVIETASAIGYFLCIAFLFYMGRASSLRSHWYVYIIFLAMGLRELDFDKRFTATGILKSKFIVADDVGLIAKIIGISILILVLASVFVWTRRHSKEFFRGVCELRASSWTAGFAMAFVVFTKSIDGLARKLEPLGVEVTAETGLLASRAEEIFELGIPITLLYAIFLYWRHSRYSQN